ncbi:MAG TPA: ABC transporter substrate-binding protein [Casimicrobiaceae bacterium]|nr:ABC transporter substrate-binding protein [Casimicrobiaceae bacterium]
MHFDIPHPLRVILAVAALLSLAPAPASAQAGDPPAQTVRAFYDSLLSVMKKAGELGVEGRYDKLAAPIRTAFDLPAMTRISVGPAWSSIAPEQQAKLVDGFERMTIATYANRFDGYAGERFEVEPTSDERPTGRLVRTRLVPASGEAVTLNYLLRSNGGQWKIVDVYLTGTISELATRRAEFAAILKAGGPAALADSLRQQAERQLQPARDGGSGAKR